MEFKNIRLEKNEGIAFITINRPTVLNALNVETFMELSQVFDMVQTDDEVRVIICTGEGDKAFVAGADINEVSRQNAVSGKVFSEIGQNVFSKVENLGKPVIAAINGFALGGGLEFALGCHIRIASKNARMGLPEVSLGVIPGYGGTQRLPRIVGKGRALELILTGKMIDAEEALRIGLVNQVVEQNELMDACVKMAREMMTKGPLAQTYVIETVNNGLETSLMEGLKHEAYCFGIMMSTEDKAEGTKAFLEKRRANFNNR